MSESERECTRVVDQDIPSAGAFFSPFFPFLFLFLYVKNLTLALLTLGSGLWAMGHYSLFIRYKGDMIMIFFFFFSFSFPVLGGGKREGRGVVWQGISVRVCVLFSGTPEWHNT